MTDIMMIEANVAVLIFIRLKARLSLIKLRFGRCNVALMAVAQRAEFQLI